MTRLQILENLKAILTQAAESDILHELAAGYANPEIVNEFCDCVSSMLAHERERNQVNDG